MKLIVAGCRDIVFPLADELIEKAFKKLDWQDEVTEIVHGGARGIDQAAERYFSGWKPISVFHADWGAFGKAAGPIRNREMANYADALLAIWDGKSKGTRNMINTAKDYGLRVAVEMTEALK